MKKYPWLILGLISFVFAISCNLDSAGKPPASATVTVDISIPWNLSASPDAKAIFGDGSVASVSVEALDSAGASKGTATLVQGASSWKGSLTGIKVDTADTFTFKVRAKDGSTPAAELYYGEATRLINHDDTTVSVSVPAAQWHRTSWTRRTPVIVAGSPALRTYQGACIASSADGTKLAVGATTDYIYTSTDSGENWIPRYPAGAGKTRIWNAIASSSDGMKLAAAASNNSIDPVGDYIYTSTDSGEHWIPRDPTNPTDSSVLGSKNEWNCMASSSDGTKLATAVHGGYVYTSTDSGVTWKKHDPGTPGSKNWYCIASSSDGLKLVATAKLAGVYTATYAAGSWTWTKQDPIIGTWYGCASSSDGTKLVVGGIGNLFYTSTDSGLNWIIRQPAGGIGSFGRWFGITSSSDGTKLAAAIGVISGSTNIYCYIYTSTDSGVSWTKREPAVTAVPVTGIPKKWWSMASSSDGKKLVVGAGSDYIYTSSSSW